MTFLSESNQRPPSQKKRKYAASVACALSLVAFAPPSFVAAQPQTAADAARASDREISLAIEKELEFDPAIHAHMVDVQSRNGIVTLSGTVDNLLARDRAAMVAGAIQGVRNVSNRIVVGPVARPDQEIQEDVNRALAQNPVTESFDMNASVQKGVVLITGRADSWAERDMATIVAQGVRGVREVNNRAKVEFTQRRPDEEIESDVKGRLVWDALVDDELIFVEVKDGVVHLQGTVGSAAEKERAWQDSWVVGVRRVDSSELQVKPWAHDEMRQKRFKYVTDKQIAQAIKQAFPFDPRIAHFNPILEVRNGEAILMGAVDSLPAKIAAEEIARNTHGVWRVRNHLKVRPASLPGAPQLDRVVEAALKRDPHLEGNEVSVRVRNGTVYLNGGVDSQFERSWAEVVASQIKGVVAVENNLRVASETSFAINDNLIEGEINEQLRWSSLVDEENIDVSVRDGVAILKGTVSSLAERDAAIYDAYQGGALSVRDQLQLEGAIRDRVSGEARS